MTEAPEFGFRAVVLNSVAYAGADRRLKHSRCLVLAALQQEVLADEEIRFALPFALVFRIGLGGGEHGLLVHGARIERKHRSRPLIQVEPRRRSPQLITSVLSGASLREVEPEHRLAAAGASCTALAKSGTAASNWP